MTAAQDIARKVARDHKSGNDLLFSAAVGIARLADQHHMKYRNICALLFEEGMVNPSTGRAFSEGWVSHRVKIGRAVLEDPTIPDRMTFAEAFSDLITINPTDKQKARPAKAKEHLSRLSRQAPAEAIAAVAEAMPIEQIARAAMAVRDTDAMERLRNLIETERLDRAAAEVLAPPAPTADFAALMRRELDRAEAAIERAHAHSRRAYAAGQTVRMEDAMRLARLTSSEVPTT